MTRAETVAEWLANVGITHSFGIIGGGNIHLWDAIYRRGATELVCTHHEQAAAIAAIGYFRTSSRLPLVLVTTGAGSTNAITGVMSAWMDSIPMLVISGNDNSKHHADSGRGFGFQGYLSWRVAQHFTKLACPLAVDNLQTAYDRAIAPRQGPVWLDFPRDLQSAVA